MQARNVRVATKAAAAPKITGKPLPAGAQRKFEELTSENNRCLDLPNVVNGFYISPKFLDKVR